LVAALPCEQQLGLVVMQPDVVVLLTSPDRINRIDQVSRHGRRDRFGQLG
jgi:hypothetical protein